jgi:hypothetical protein
LEEFDLLLGKLRENVRFQRGQNKGGETIQNALCDSQSKAMSEQTTNSSERVNLR